MLDDLDAGLVVAVEELVGDLAFENLVGELQGLGAEPLGVDDRDQRVGHDAANGSRLLEILEAAHPASCSVELTRSTQPRYP